KLNDVVLAICAGGVRRFLRDSGEDPARLKTMVPVSVRDRGGVDQLGNAISFMFVDLPCDEPDPVRRVREVRAATARRKDGGVPAAGADVIRSIGLIPPAARSLVSRAIASPRTFNLVVSNIPGPGEPLYMRASRVGAGMHLIARKRSRRRRRNEREDRRRKGPYEEGRRRARERSEPEGPRARRPRARQGEEGRRQGGDEDEARHEAGVLARVV